MIHERMSDLKALYIYIYILTSVKKLNLWYLYWKVEFVVVVMVGAWATFHKVLAFLPCCKVNDPM